MKKELYKILKDIWNGEINMEVVSGMEVVSNMKKESELLALYDECMEFWGLEKQLRMVQEECAELILAVSHYLRGREDGHDNLIEELADVRLITDQIIHHFGKNKIKCIIDIKSDYVKRKLEKDKEKEYGI
jgi:hypothetical protein